MPPTPNGWPRNELWGGKDTRKDTFGWTFLQAVAARMRDLTRHHSVNKPYTEGDITFPEPVWVQVSCTLLPRSGLALNAEDPCRRGHAVVHNSVVQQHGHQ